MIRLDIRGRALNLIGFKELSQEVKEVLVERMIELAISVINKDIATRFGVVDLEDVISVIENEYGILTPDELIQSHIIEINKAVKQLGWDPRLILRIEYKKIPKRLNVCLITMDLDATIARNTQTVIKRKINIEDLVSVTPDLDDINSLLARMDKENHDREKILSGRFKTPRSGIRGRNK